MDSEQFANVGRLGDCARPKIEQHALGIVPGLPDDIGFQCLARVPFKYHPGLAQVSKEWRQAIRSHTIFRLRKALSVGERYIYVLGIDTSECLHWYVLDPVRQEWRELPAMPGDFSQRLGVSVHVLERELFVMGGGAKYMHPTPEVIRYDPVLNQWRDVASMNIGRFFFGSVVWNSKLHAIGGWGGSSVPLTCWEFYDPQHNSWSRHDGSVVASQGVEALVFHDNFFISHMSQVNHPAEYAALYNATQGVWTQVDNILSRRWTGPTAAVGKDIYMLNESDLHACLMILDRNTSNWRALGRLSPGQFCPPCRMVALNRKLYIVGEDCKTNIVDLDALVCSVEGVIQTTHIEGPNWHRSGVIGCHVMGL